MRPRAVGATVRVGGVPVLSCKMLQIRPCWPRRNQTMSHMPAHTWRRLGGILLATVVATTTFSTPARAQDAMNKEAAAAVKAAFMADLDTMKGKFVGLAQAFPADKYAWRPMEGVRSVSEVFVLICNEGYGFIPTGFGGQRGSQEDMAALRNLTD